MDLTTARDSLGRLFDPKKFKPRFDTLKRWVVANAGRKPAKKARQLSLPTMSTPTDPTTPPPAAEPTQPPPPEPSAGPSFADLDEAEKTAPAPSVEGLAEQIEAATAPGSTPTAETIIGIIQTVLMLIGEEEGILTNQEKLIIRPPLMAVLKKYNVGDDILPAEVSLMLALAGLVVTRLKKPKTATFAAKVRTWLVDLWLSRKGREIQRVVTREASP